MTFFGLSRSPGSEKVCGLQIQQQTSAPQRGFYASCGCAQTIRATKKTLGKAGI